MATEVEEHEVVKVDKELVHEPQDTKPIPITIIKPTTKTNLEAEIIESLSKPQLTDLILEVLIPQQPKGSSLTTPKADRGKDIARDIDDSPTKLIKASREVRLVYDAPVVEEVASEAGVDPKILRSIKGGTTFLKKQDTEFKRKAIELEPEVRITGLECNRSLPEGVQFVNNMLIEQTEHEIFFIDAFGDQAYQRVSDSHQVKIESLLGYMVMAGNVKTPENQRFCVKMRKMIDERPDKVKLHSK
ncbi:hypothetical protein Tco_1400405 [Tanacetum coccineum]